MKFKPTRGYVLIQLHDAQDEIDGIALIDAGNAQRYGTVIEIADPYIHIGKTEYSEGDVVMVPAIGSHFQFKDEENDYIVLLQSEIKVIVYEDSVEQGISRF